MKELLTSAETAAHFSVITNKEHKNRKTRQLVKEMDGPYKQDTVSLDMTQYAPRCLGKCGAGKGTKRYGMLIRENNKQNYRK